MKEEVVIVKAEYRYEPTETDFPYIVVIHVYGKEWDNHFCKLCSTKKGTKNFLYNIKRKLKRNFKRMGIKLLFNTSLKEVK